MTQMYASLMYIQTRHPYGDIPGQPSQAPASASNSAAAALTNGDASQQQSHPTRNTTEQRTEPPSTPPPEQPDVFNSALRELAQDLVLKEQQMEIIINSLPGLGNSEADQENLMRRYEIELRDAEAERSQAEEERERMVGVLGEVINKVRRVP